MAWMNQNLDTPKMSERNPHGMREALRGKCTFQCVRIVFDVWHYILRGDASRMVRCNRFERRQHDKQIIPLVLRGVRTEGIRISE